MSRNVARILALGTSALALIAFTGPARAVAPDRASATATAAKVDVLGHDVGTGAVNATTDGATVLSSGQVIPRTTLGGIAVQDATVTTSGTSRACAGIGAAGSTVVRTDGLSCFVPGATSSIDLGALALPTPQLPAGSPASAATALTQALQSVGTPHLVLESDLLQSTCTAGNGVASATSHLGDARIALEIPGQAPVTILALPADPAPNTRLVGDLSEGSALLESTLRSALTDSLGGLLGQLAPLLGPNPLDAVLDQFDQLLVVPLADQGLVVKLNEQHVGAGSVDTSALSLRVAPSGTGLGFQPVSAQLGQVSCFSSPEPAVAAAPAARSVVVPQVADAVRRGVDAAVFAGR